MGEATLSNVVAIKCMLRGFELVSGLKLNFFKSCFGFIGVPLVDTERYAHLLKCKILSLPFVYLGIPIGANPRLVDTWKPIVHKFARKLSSWKHKVLSMVGRVCLINFILSSFPLFFLSFFKLPKRVVRVLYKYKEISCEVVRRGKNKFVGKVGILFVYLKHEGD